MTRIMKIVPASRLVTDASLEPPSKPPSIDRSRAIMPAGRVVADGASIAATAEIPLGYRKGAATIGPINDSLRFGWMGLYVVIPGRREASNPESRDSRFAPVRAPDDAIPVSYTHLTLPT